MKVKCAFVECAFNDDHNRCTAKEISLGYHFVNTVHQGQQEYLKCNQFVESPEARRIREMFFNENH